MMSRIVFMGTPEFAVPILEELIAGHELVGVITQPDRPAGRGRIIHQSPVKLVAQSHGIPTYQPTTLRSDAAIAPIRNWSPDIIVVAAFGQILPKNLLELPPKGCLNVHASLLPRWRGAAPIQHAILAGDQVSGISLMSMDEGLDTGPVFVQEPIAISERETAATLHDRLAYLAVTMLNEFLPSILQGDLSPEAQDESRKTYAPMITKDDGWIDWSLSTMEIDRQIRAMTPWPGASTHWKGKRVKILSARPLHHKKPVTGQPGQVVSQQGFVAITTNDGLISVEQVQLAGKRATEIAAFLNGHPDFLGSQLPN